ncbi:LigA [Anaeromyxobacter sp. Fw109-5]|nr:LigA [Anaeromyxobacter sp. Fw109-5]
MRRGRAANAGPRERSRTARRAGHAARAGTPQRAVRQPVRSGARRGSPRCAVAHRAAHDQQHHRDRGAGVRIGHLRSRRGRAHPLDRVLGIPRRGAGDRPSRAFTPFPAAHRRPYRVLGRWSLRREPRADGAAAARGCGAGAARRARLLFGRRTRRRDVRRRAQALRRAAGRGDRRAGHRPRDVARVRVGREQRDLTSSERVGRLARFTRSALLATCLRAPAAHQSRRSAPPREVQSRANRLEGVEEWDARRLDRLALAPYPRRQELPGGGGLRPRSPATGFARPGGEGRARRAARRALVHERDPVRHDSPRSSARVRSQARAAPRRLEMRAACVRRRAGSAGHGLRRAAAGGRAARRRSRTNAAALACGGVPGCRRSRVARAAAGQRRLDGPASSDVGRDVGSGALARHSTSFPGRPAVRARRRPARRARGALRERPRPRPRRSRLRKDAARRGGGAPSRCGGEARAPTVLHAAAAQVARGPPRRQRRRSPDGERVREVHRRCRGRAEPAGGPHRERLLAGHLRARGGPLRAALGRGRGRRGPGPHLRGLVPNPRARRGRAPVGLLRSRPGLLARSRAAPGPVHDDVPADPRPALPGGCRRARWALRRREGGREGDRGGRTGPHARARRVRRRREDGRPRGGGDRSPALAGADARRHRGGVVARPDRLGRHPPARANRATRVRARGRSGDGEPPRRGHLPALEGARAARHRGRGRGPDREAVRDADAHRAHPSARCGADRGASPGRRALAGAEVNTNETAAGANPAGLADEGEGTRTLRVHLDCPRGLCLG